MKSASLYRTWRPLTFDDLVGQDTVVRTLKAALTSGRISHAYLFSGPRGSGKTSAAKLFARCIECIAGPTPSPDNSCPNCLAILAGTAMDVIEVDAASNRGIEEIKSLRDSAKFAPSTMRKKVFIIDEAHMLTKEGANAFLKTLEEPPEHVVFILATTAPEALPQTILSRCQRYAFKRISVPIIIERMRFISLAEEIDIDDEALAAIAYRADGGLRDALTILEQVANYAGSGEGVSVITQGTVNTVFGSTGQEYGRVITRAVLSKDGKAALEAVESANDMGVDLGNLIKNIVNEFRSILVAQIAPNLLASELSETDRTAIQELAATTTSEKVSYGLQLLGEASTNAKASGNPRLELESVLLQLIFIENDVNMQSLALRLAKLEENKPQETVSQVTRILPEEIIKNTSMLEYARKKFKERE